MKNKLTDLNNHLFMQLERLSDESMSGDQVATEMQRTKAVTAVAREIIANGRLVLDAEKAMHENAVRSEMPLLESSE